MITKITANPLNTNSTVTMARSITAGGMKISWRWISGAIRFPFQLMNEDVGEFAARYACAAQLKTGEKTRCSCVRKSGE
jgi:hypothetical protein